MVRGKHFTPERWLCYSLTLVLTLAVVAVVAVVTRHVDKVAEGDENAANNIAARNGHVWHYRCELDRCVKLPITSDTEAPIGLVQCRQMCGPGARSHGLDVWPQLTGATTATTGNAVSYAPIWLPELRFQEPAVVVQPDIPFWQLNHERLVAQIRAKRPSTLTSPEPTLATGDRTRVTVSFAVNSDDAKLHMAGNETYRLTVSAVQNGAVGVSIEAETIFGARHGIETLSQLVIYDDINDRYLVSIRRQSKHI